MTNILTYCYNASLSHNPIYSIHQSNISLATSFCLLSLFLLTWLSINKIDIVCNFYVLVFVLLPSVNLYFTLQGIYLLVLWLLLSMWLYDLWIESLLFYTLSEQRAVTLAIKLVIASELMLFISCFWCYIDYRLTSHILIFPSLSTYAFSIPFTNLLLLLFSSLPLQSAYIAIKLSYMYEFLIGLVRVLLISMLFILLQLKEFLYSLYSISDGLLGSVYYFTTGLHGTHVVLGSFLLWSILYSSLIYWTYSVELSLSLLLASYYWHFVDMIWFVVFSLYIV